MQSKLLRGTFILTLGSLISKILGLLYVIPFYHIVGDEGQALYAYAYVPYTIFLSLATTGIPAAVAKYIAKYNALEEYAVGRKLFKSGIVVMSLTGVVAFASLYYLAPSIASASSADLNVESTITVIRAVSYALLLVPIMSIIRGFFQGHQSMGPFAISQVVEQIVRIVFLLIGAFVVIQLLDGTITEAVSVATFAAFIGAIGGLFVLFYYFKKRKPYFDQLLEEDKQTLDISLKDMYKEIIIYAAPFVFVGLNNSLFQLVDQFTVNSTLLSIGYTKAEVTTAYAVLSMQTHKLVIIPVTLAVAFSTTLIPVITDAFTKADKTKLHTQLNQTFQVVLYLTLPAAIGISLLAEPIFTLFYEYKEVGSLVLRVYAPVALLFAFFLVTSSIIQGINQQRFTVISLIIGLVTKIILNPILLKLCGITGAVYATAIGYTAAIAMNLYIIGKYANYSFKLPLKRGLLILIFNGIMLLFTGGVYQVLSLFLSTSKKLDSMIIIIITAIVGVLVYASLSFKSKLVYILFGNKVRRLLEKLRII